MDKTALIVIDAQQEYFAPLGKVVLPGGPAAVKRIARALDWARGAKVPVIHIVHESRKAGAAIFAPGSPALAIHPDATPQAGEPIFTKHLPGSFTGTPLEATLRARGIERLVLAGFMTQMCIDTTARQGAHLRHRARGRDGGEERDEPGRRDDPGRSRASDAPRQPQRISRGDQGNRLVVKGPGKARARASSRVDGTRTRSGGASGMPPMAPMPRAGSPSNDRDAARRAPRDSAARDPCRRHGSRLPGTCRGRRRAARGFRPAR